MGASSLWSGARPRPLNELTWVVFAGVYWLAGTALMSAIFDPCHAAAFEGGTNSRVERLLGFCI